MNGTLAFRLGTLAAGVTMALATTAGTANASGTASAASAPAAPAGTASVTSAAHPTGAALPPPREVRGAPVDPTPRTLVQPDGTSFTAVQHGDAVRHWWTAKGATVARSAGGTWRFATGLDASGQPAPVGAPVSPRAASPDAAVGLSPVEDGATLQTDLAMPAAGFVGQQKSLVILAQFTTRKSVGTTPTQWNARFFGATDSVRAFYKGASSGLLDLSPATETFGTANDGVIGWVTLPIAHPNYYNLLQNGSQDVAARAIRAAAPYIDYASYDTNANGVIEPAELHLTVIAAGYEAAYGGTSACTPNVWGHRWAINSGAPVVDGKTVGSLGYTQFGEYHCDTGNSKGAHQATIGIMAHEFGHDLGWPDLYDTEASSEGVGNWSLMAAGSWGTKSGSSTSGDAPVLPDAWSRSVQSWVTPVQVTSTRTVSLPQVTATDTVFRLLPDANGPQTWGTGGEFFLVENRQKAGLDTALPGCGLVVYHVRESLTENSTVSSRVVDVVEADGLEGLNKAGYRGGPGDAWHGVSSHAVLTSWTTPSTRLNNGTTTTARMTAKGGCAATMSATLTAGSVTYPRDVTGDGHADVVTVEASGGALRVYPTTGTGAWKTPIRSGSGWTGYAKVLTAGTWDGDPISDVIVQDKAGGLFLRSGNGNGTFAASVRIGSGWTVHDLVMPVGDFDGDGLTDLVARRADGVLFLYSGNGRGGFASGAGRRIGAGWDTFTAVFSPGDFSGDGLPDLLARTAGGTVYLYRGNGVGGWLLPRATVGTGWQQYTALTSPGDFTGDGRADVLARTADSTLYVIPGDGHGAFTARAKVGAGWNIFSKILL